MNKTDLMPETLIQTCIKTVGRGARSRKPLDFEQAFQVMSAYLADDNQDKIGDDQMAMLLMLIRVNEETPQEIAGFIQAFQHQLSNDLTPVDIDWPCYAGKRKEAPWHGLAAKILSTKGYRILLHGHLDKLDQRSHIRQYLEALKIPKAQTLSQVETLLNQAHIAYLDLETISTKAQKMMDWKARYGLRTPMNTIARGLNPFRAELGVRGSFHPGYAKLHAQVDALLSQDDLTVVSFKGQHGEAEFNPNVSQDIWLSQHHEVFSHYWPAVKIDNPNLPKTFIFEGDNAQQIQIANVVISTMATVIFAHHCQGNSFDTGMKDLDHSQAVLIARQYWNDYCLMN